MGWLQAETASAEQDLDQIIERVRSHGAQLPVLSSKRTLAQLKIQDWGRAVALKDTAAAATEKKSHHLHISCRLFGIRGKLTTDKRKGSAQPANRVAINPSSLKIM